MAYPRNNNPVLNAELQAVEQQFADEVAAIDAPNQIHYDSEKHRFFAQREERKRIIYAAYGLIYKKKRYMDYYTIEYREEPENYPRENESYPGFNAFENWEAAAANGAASVGTADPNAASELEGNALSQVGVNDEFLAEFENESENNNAESVYSTNSNVSNNNPTPLKRRRGNRYNNNNNNNRRTRRRLFQEPTAPAGGRRRHRHTKKCKCRNNRKSKRSVKGLSVKRLSALRRTHRAPRK